MEPLLVLGATITAIGVLSDIAAPARVWRCRSVEGVSVTSQMLTVWLCLSWGLYGILRHDLTQMAVNGAALIATFILIAGMFRFGKARALAIATLPTFLWATLLLITANISGYAGVGVAASALSITFKLPQVRLAWREPGGMGLSVASWSFDLASSLLWIAYGLVAADAAVVVTALWGVAVKSFVIVRTVGGRRAQVATDDALTTGRYALSVQ